MFSLIFFFFFLVLGTVDLKTSGCSRVIVLIISDSLNEQNKLIAKRVVIWNLEYLEMFSRKTYKPLIKT